MEETRQIMKTRHTVIFAACALLFLASGCSEERTTSATISFTGGNSASAAKGVTTASGATVSFSALNLTVTNAAGMAVFSKTYPVSIAESGGVTIELPADVPLTFRAAARDATLDDGTAVTHVSCAGSTGPVTLKADTDTAVTITLNSSELAKDALISVLSSFDPAKYGSVVVASIRYGLYIPVIKADNTITLDESNPVYEVTAAPGTVPAITAYPDTYQILVIKAFAADGGVSFLGGGVVSSLVTGTNSVPVTMIPAARILVTISDYDAGNPTPVVFYETIYDGLGTAIDVPLMTVDAWTGSALVYAYSGVTAAADKTGFARILHVTYNNMTYDKIYPADNPLGWGERTWILP